MPTPTPVCPHCHRKVSRVIHTVGEQPVVLPCGHPVHYRYDDDGEVTLRAAEGRQQAAVVNPIPRVA